MKKTINILLAVTIILPLALLFWPFVVWNDTMAIILRIIPSLAAQLLMYRAGSSYLTKAAPLLFTGAFAAWGTCLYFTSPHWSNATFVDLMADYVSPFICCIVVYFACRLIKTKL